MGCQHDAHGDCYFGYLYGYKCQGKHHCQSSSGHSCTKSGPKCCHPSIRGLFDHYNIGTLLIIGTEAGKWQGLYAGIEDDIVLLFSAHLDNDPAVHSPVRIPLNEIVYVTI